MTPLKPASIVAAPPGSNPEPTTARKRSARADLRRRRRDHVAGLADRIAAEAALAARLLAIIPTGAIVATYAAKASEIDPAPLHPHLAGLAWPRVGGTLLTFHRCTAADLAPGHSGIAEPPATAPRVRPAIVLVPLLAATPAGRRLGQGGGFYDRTLAGLRAAAADAGPVLAVGLAWDLQLVDELATDPWDELLDWIATPTRLVECVRFR